MEAFERLHALIQEGSYAIILPLMALAAVMLTLVAERTVFYFGSILGLFWPRARRRVREQEALVTDALDSYLARPTRAARARLLHAAAGLSTPVGRFLVKLLRDEGLVRQPGHLRELQIAEASLRESLEIQRGLAMISCLAKAAPLMGLLGTVIGMIQTFRAMTVASTSDPRALSSGISIALIATEVGLIVAMPGVVSMSGLSRRAQSLEEEINLAGMRLKQAEPEEPEVPDRDPAWVPT